MDALAGRAVVVQEGARRRQGDALGLAGDGALRVQVDGREERVHAGEVSIRVAA